MLSILRGNNAIAPECRRKDESDLGLFCGQRGSQDRPPSVTTPLSGHCHHPIFIRVHCQFSLEQWRKVKMDDLCVLKRKIRIIIIMCYDRNRGTIPHLLVKNLDGSTSVSIQVGRCLRRSLDLTFRSKSPFQVILGTLALL
ncbi:hypothetical protein Ahy_B02g059573 isoform D [Arachis hypogaea]|uniref:Uncharacterized protein n=1 Tax=Arachis hypogaea TaxID=3818 RepID=A0A445AGV7_ARAHY|nr:hypothetical protein Ahy_B02g059573 isoform D [Arachis hypogaea]